MSLFFAADLTTLYRAQTEYQSEFRRHWQEASTGSIQWDMIKILEKGKMILKKHLEVFVAEGLCPNKCGLLFQSVMNCSSCQYGLHKCQSETPPKDCGEHQVLANVGEQAVLDCFLPWHSLVVGHAEYHYSWKQGATNFSAEDRFEVLVVTKDSKIVLNQLSVSEQGVYRCFLLDQHGTTLSHTLFILTVIPMPTSPPRQIPTLPSLPRVDVRHVQLHTDTLIIALALLVVLSISGSLTIILHVVLIIGGSLTCNGWMDGWMAPYKLEKHFTAVPAYDEQADDGETAEESRSGRRRREHKMEGKTQDST
ncbi:izumo sperm-egg fusion protein 1 isoform X2 [Pangasianodon hypophthalmus]|uniref:izumo sperm-egg fusion protein 1 isoform X2 n=1 Tax=Pangasianodon hypophthalmus TaxID=310915 RepID=UPI0023074119|nr:izumo sperm-egg fusion protein 1 isoform X2 [Pangasianodon hypophthalmus]